MLLLASSSTTSTRGLGAPPCGVDKVVLKSCPSDASANEVNELDRGHEVVYIWCYAWLSESWSEFHENMIACNYL